MKKVLVILVLSVIGAAPAMAQPFNMAKGAIVTAKIPATMRRHATTSCVRPLPHSGTSQPLLFASTCLQQSCTHHARSPIALATD